MPGGIYTYITGYAKLRITGVSIEKFINKVQSSDIILFDIKRNKYKELTFKVNRCDLEKIKRVSTELHLDMEIINETGFLYYLQIFLQNRSFVLGVIIGMLLLYLATSFIWIVEIRGNEKVKTDELKTIIEDLGVKRGVLKSTIDHDKFIIELLNKESRLTWAELEIKGVRAMVRVAEGEKPPEVIDADTPCNIVARRDGFLLKLLPLNGERAVDDNNAVKKGQILVSGIIHSELSGTRYVHAMGQAWAHTYYEGEAEVDISDYLYEESGNHKVRYELVLNNTVIPMYFKDDDIDFKRYSVATENVFPEITTGYIPVHIRKITYKELMEKSFDEAMRLAKSKCEELAFQKSKELIPYNGKILQKFVKSDMTPQGNVHSKVTIEVLEDIAEEEKMIMSEEDEFGK